MDVDEERRGQPICQSKFKIARGRASMTRTRHAHLACLQSLDVETEARKLDIQQG